MTHRIERDALGEMPVPESAFYGAQTARAIENFPVSGIRLSRQMIRALGLIKRAAAEVNRELGLLDAELAQVIVKAAEEVAEGKLDEHFPVDVFQTGSGTSSNMNANEVIANRAILALGGQIGSKAPVHPNNHVNMGQSSNDVFPSAIHLAAMDLVTHHLEPALKGLQKALVTKAQAFDGIVKIGRTHLQDATPIRLGQEFSGYASQVEHWLLHIENAKAHLAELAIGGTAVGTGINTHPDFGKRMAQRLSELTGLSFKEAANHFEAQASQDANVQFSGTLKTVAVGLSKIANDIRWLGSGPRLGLGELLIPAVQPGSSIMPGKVNPVIAEAVLMACAQVIGHDAAIALGGLNSNFELNMMLPLIAHNLLQQIQLLANATLIFAAKLINGLEANVKQIQARVEESLALVTPLAPVIGYDSAAEIAKESWASGKTIGQIAREKKILPEKELERLLDLRRGTEPGL